MDEHVKSLYDMATTASSARTSMDDAIKYGQLTQYHRTLRETPEVTLVKPLVAVRRQLSELSRERRRVMTTTRDEVRRDNEVDALTKAMSAIAHGTLLWANEQLGIETTPTTTQPMTPTNGAVPNGEVA